jgi:hypothetical protein
MEWKKKWKVESGCVGDNTAIKVWRKWREAEPAENFGEYFGGCTNTNNQHKKTATSS